MKYKQLFLFEEDYGDANDDTPADSSTQTASRGPPRGNHVPHYTYAISDHKTACISIQTGEHIEDFKFHTKDFTPTEFEERVREYCKQLLGIFREDEIFLRRITALRARRNAPSQARDARRAGVQTMKVRIATVPFGKSSNINYNYDRDVTLSASECGVDVFIGDTVMILEGTITPSEARNLATVLERAADEVERIQRVLERAADEVERRKQEQK